MRVNVQLTLPDDLAAELGAEAESLHLGLEEFIQRTIREKLDLKQKREIPSKDPLSFMRGKLDTEEHDRAQRVDETLYGDRVR